MPFPKSSLIVSCQAEGDDPFNNLDSVVRFALAAKMGGAQGIRSEGIERTQAIVEATGLPVIGLVKGVFPDGTVKITGNENSVVELIKLGCSAIAIDGTSREREGLDGPAFIRKIKGLYSCKIMADISTEEEGIACFEAGADWVSTTLNGYTPWTVEDCLIPNFKLLKTLVSLGIPTVAEGRINTAEEAGMAIRLGAEFVVVGSAITRPRLITRNFVNAINKNGNKN